ncbi:hypothetical protein N0V90_000664 [Kalmusia sp. IMI 367209]|nr:hypothetical protein N0V90_000664 [Kalmusia sp. IMI 367209]
MDTDLLQLLLQHGSRQQREIEEATVFAAETMNPVIVRALLAKAPASGVVDRAFARLLDSNKIRTTNDASVTAVALLERGVKQSLKDRALVQSLKAYQHDRSDFFKELIQQGANVNTESCICLILVAQFSTLDMFELLLRSNANFDRVIESLIIQFPQDNYERLMQLVHTVFKCELYRSDRLEVNVILQAMHRFGRGAGLVRLLLDHGYPPGQTIQSEDGDTKEAQVVTPLIWALGQPSPGVSDEVILELLEEGKLAFLTSRSGTTAVHMAAQLERHAILERLIQIEVDLSVVDSSAKSPLFYATANANAISVYLLLENGAQSNDGSLQEAARLCQKDIVLLLLAKDHDPDYSCDLHEGRTALGELCSETNLETGEQISAAYEIVKLLINASTDLSFKTILHLALDNKHPIEITRALLRFPEIYKEIRTDSELFLYEDSQQRYMSPDEYVKQYCKLGDRVRLLLVELLVQKGCKEKWFTKRGDQPAGYKGLPPALKEEMERQDLADQAEQHEIKRRKQTAQVERDIQKGHHMASMIQSKERADLELFNTQRHNDQQIAHDSRLAIQRRNNSNAERADERYHLKEKDRLTYEATRKRTELEYSSQQRLKELEHVSAERQAGLERKLIESREAAESRSEVRAMERFARQDQSIRLAAQEQRALLAVPHVPRNSKEQLALEWEKPD